MTVIADLEDLQMVELHLISMRNMLLAAMMSSRLSDSERHALIKACLEDLESAKSIVEKYVQPRKREHENNRGNREDAEHPASE